MTDVKQEPKKPYRPTSTIDIAVRAFLMVWVLLWPFSVWDPNKYMPAWAWIYMVAMFVAIVVGMAWAWAATD